MSPSQKANASSSSMGTTRSLFIDALLVALPTELMALKMAGLAGFEPTNDGVKVRCLTAWL